MSVRVGIAGIVVAGCGASASPVVGPANLAGADPDALVVSADEPLGWLGLAPTPTFHDGPLAFLPIGGAAAVVVPTPAPRLTPGLKVTVVPHHGPPADATVGDPMAIRYGCEDNQLEVVPVIGAAVAPGVVWIPPMPRPARWSPAAVPVVAGGVATDRRSWTVGDLAIDLTRLDPMHAQLALSHSGHRLHDQIVEKSLMDGAAPGPIDLTTEVPGVPIPVAAYALGARGPTLVVFAIPGYEGVTLSPWLVDHGRAREVLALSVYLYACAF